MNEIERLRKLADVDSASIAGIDVTDAVLRDLRSHSFQPPDDTGIWRVAAGTCILAAALSLALAGDYWNTLQNPLAQLAGPAPAELR